MIGVSKIAVILAILMVASACMGSRTVTSTAPADREANIRAALLYDADKNGEVSRQEMEAGLAKEMAAADSDGDGVLNLSEMQAENQRRFVANQTGFSPLIDWNRDGKVDKVEFSTTIRSMFAEMDADQNGVLSGVELRLPRARPPQGPPAGRARGR